MQREETKKMILYLAAAFPNQKEKLWKDEVEMQSFVAVWHNIMYVFPIEIARKAVMDYVKQGKIFFPALGEIAALCDDLWRQEVENQRVENIQTEREATKLLFHQPLSKFADNYTRKSVELIRKVYNGDIKFMSPEWKEEFRAIYGDGCNPERG